MYKVNGDFHYKSHLSLYTLCLLALYTSKTDSFFWATRKYKFYIIIVRIHICHCLYIFDSNSFHQLFVWMDQCRSVSILYTADETIHGSTYTESFLIQASLCLCHSTASCSYSIAAKQSMTIKLIVHKIVWFRLHNLCSFNTYAYKSAENGYSFNGQICMLSIYFANINHYYYDCRHSEEQPHWTKV